MISIDNLSVSVESRSLLSTISLNIGKGDRLAIYGHGGSGKSLLLDFIAGKKQETLTYDYLNHVDTFGKKSYFDLNKNWTRSIINLITSPIDLCLIDEPENGVSLERFKTYCEYLKSEEASIVFVTHHLQYVEDCSDKVLILKKGESKGLFTKQDFFNSQDPYVQYVSTMGC